MTIVRSYSELSRLDTFDDRFDYLKLDGGVAHPTFGFDRHINQDFYSSRQWQQARNYVIYRDDGCDLGVPGYEIHVGLYVHHMNPLSMDDIVHGEEWILDPEFLITTSHKTHNAIHYGVESLTPKVVADRSPGDTDLWSRR